MTMLITNDAGSFALFGISSRFAGVSFWNGTMFHAIAALEPQRSVMFAKKHPVIFINGSCDILLDCRKNFDMREWGRHYSFEHIGKTTLVHFEKKNDSREAQGSEYTFWLAIHGSACQIINTWEQHEYAFDKARNSPPPSRWVNRALKTEGDVVVAFGETKEQALENALCCWKNEKLKKKTVVCDGLSCAKESLRSLRIRHGLFAGLPWFHQRWARDELICAKALCMIGEKEHAKRIILDWLRKVSPNGKMQGTMTTNIADGAWMFVRAAEMLDEFSPDEKALLKKQLNLFLSGLHPGLVMSGSKETWMDSLERAGACVEIQALTLAACRLADAIGVHQTIEQALREKTRVFKDGRDLADDDTIRPNVFIAAYVYPELFSKKQWVSIFDNILPKLWCSWGGLATVDTSSSLFTAHHSGENPASYHNGDSWYWINNLAAIVMHRIDPVHYKKYIDHIFKASRKDIMSLGAIGHHSELSSAMKQTASGCLAQAWSAALFIELCYELRKH